MNRECEGDKNYCHYRAEIVLQNKVVEIMNKELMEHKQDFNEFKKEVFLKLDDFVEGIGHKFERLDEKYSSKRVEKVLIWFVSIVGLSMVLGFITVITFLFKLYYKSL